MEEPKEQNIQSLLPKEETISPKITKTKNPLLIAGLIIVIIGSLIAAGYLYWKGKQAPSKEQNIGADNQVNNTAITLDGEDLLIGKSSTQNGNITIIGGDATIESNSTINGRITITNGNLTIGNSVTISDEIWIEDGDINIGSNGVFEKIYLTGNFTAGNSNNFITISIKGENKNLEIGSNNTVVQDLSNEKGKVRIGNSNNIGGFITANSFEKGDNNTIATENTIVINGVNVTYLSSVTEEDVVYLSKYLIFPYTDYYKPESFESIRITKTQDSFSIEAEWAETGLQEGFLFSKETGLGNFIYWMPECVDTDCTFEEAYEAKYPEIVNKYKDIHDGDLPVSSNLYKVTVEEKSGYDTATGFPGGEALFTEYFADLVGIAGTDIEHIAFDTEESSPFGATGTSVYYVITDTDITGSFDDAYAEITIENESAELVPYVENEDYCEVYTDCVIRENFCAYGSYNKYMRYIDVWGCEGSVTDETGYVYGSDMGDPIIDPGLGCQTEVNFTGSTCSSNVCTGTGRTVTCVE